MNTDEEILEIAFREIGDISGLTVFDAGPEGVASKYLAERIREGRVIGVNVWLDAYRKVRERLGDKLMDKIVFIKDDMQQIDYVKDGFFDVVVSYDTLISVESMTPGGTLPVLRQFYRILKLGGWFLAIEHPSLREMKPTNRGQELEIELRRLLYQIRRQEFGKGTYEPGHLSQMLKRIGFTGMYWRTVSEGSFAAAEEVSDMIKGLRNFAKERVQDVKEKETIFRQIEELAYQAQKDGFCGPPYYSMYARKPVTVSATT